MKIFLLFFIIILNAQPANDNSIEYFPQNNFLKFCLNCKEDLEPLNEDNLIGNRFGFKK